MTPREDLHVFQRTEVTEWGIPWLLCSPYLQWLAMLPGKSPATQAIDVTATKCEVQILANAYIFELLRNTVSLGMTKNSFIPPDIRKQALNVVFDSIYRCEHLLRLMKDVESRRRVVEHLAGCMQIVTTEIKPDIKVNHAKQCQISH